MPKQGKDDSRLKEVVFSLAEGIPLEPRNNDHPLFGNGPISENAISIPIGF